MSLVQVIAAEGEQKASRALREAAEVIAESPSALQVQLRVTSLTVKAKVHKRKSESRNKSENVPKEIRDGVLHHLRVLHCLLCLVVPVTRVWGKFVRSNF